MPKITQSTIMPYSQQALYELINDVTNYPKFIPFCTAAAIHEQSDEHLLASVTLQKGPLKESFTTRNELYPYEKMVLHLVDGPFKQLEGAWLFEPKGEQCTLVTLNLDYAFSSKIVAAVFGSLFQKVAQSLVNNFTTYAKQVLS